MPAQLRLMVSTETARLLPILRDADEGDERILLNIMDEKHTSYIVLNGEQVVGAITMCWDTQESEIIYIAVVQDLRRKGYGRVILMDVVCEEARKRGVRSLLIGTDNTALDTIGFYQRCGFRMDHVRRDFFAYVQPPLTNNGIPLRDMLVLRYELFERE